MSIKKYTDWRGYFEGLYLTWIKTITTTGLTLLGTNGAEQMGLKGIGISWKQALSMFLTITVVEIFKYLQAKPLPEVKTEEVETTFTSKLPLWLLCGFLALGGLTACQTPPQNIAYKSEAVVISTVDSAMKAWGDYVRSHPETPQAQRDTVHRAYDKYFASQLVARAALEQWVSVAQNPSLSQTAKDASLMANADVAEAGEALIELVKGLLK